MSAATDVEFIAEDRERIEAKILPPTLDALLTEAVSHYADQPFWMTVDGDGTILTYAMFKQLVDRYAWALKRFGVRRGTHVAVVMANSPDLGALWLALSRLGAVAIGVNSGLTRPELQFVLASADAEVLIAEHDAIPPYDDREGHGVPVEPARIIIRGADPGPGERRWTDVMSGATRPTGPELVDTDDMASMLFTSGSTGAPKPCMLSHRWHTMMGWVRSQQGPAARRIAIDSPLYYMGGQWRLAMAMHLGAAICVAARPSLSRFLDRLLAHNADFFTASTLIAKLPADPRYEQLSLSWVASSGLAKELHEALERRLRAPVREIYGSTELGSAIVMPAAATSLVGSGSCGMPAAWRSCRIVDPSGQEVQPGQAGELLVKGPGLFLGYYNRPDANSASFADGWFRTGDLFVQDRDGFFYWQARIKDVIRRSGQNISGSEVEAAIRMIAEVQEVAAVPVSDEFRGEEVKVYILLAPNVRQQDMQPEQIIAHCRQRLAQYKIPRYFEYVVEFPRTVSGKIKKQSLREAKSDLRQDSFDSLEAVWR